MSDIPPRVTRAMDNLGELPPSLEIVDVMIYARTFDGKCSLCWHRDFVMLVELSFKTRRKADRVTWMARAVCPICRRILEQRAVGKVTYCPF